MADPASYHARWRQLLALADRSASVLEGDADWEIVFRFYASMHLVEGLMRTKDSRFWSDKHETRRGALKGSPEVRGALAPYLDLQDLSENVRYDPGFIVDETHFEKAKQWATKVESVVRAKLEAKLPVPPTPQPAS